jgi:hypothetical protein
MKYMNIFIKDIRVAFESICGVVLGFEYVPEYQVIMIDLVILRILIDWSGEEFI